MKKHIYMLIGIVLLISFFNYLVELNKYTPSNGVTVGGGNINQNIKVADFAISPITYEEYCVNDDNQKTKCHELQNIQNGDILISKSSHTLLFRHGHAGIVVDAEAGLVLEAIGYGTPSMLQPIDKWNYFPAVKVLRLKDATEDLINEIVEISLNDYQDIKYDILARRNDNSSTHCSDIVWKVFNAFGYDLDSNGGLFVSPQDISKSEHLYEVESYGFSPSRAW